MQAATAEPARIGIELQRRFRASPERVFRAWTQPVALREWWCPPGWVAGEIEIDLRIGGAYRIEMSRTGTAGARVSVGGHFLEVRPPERLVYTALGGCLCGNAGNAGDPGAARVGQPNAVDIAPRQFHRSRPAPSAPQRLALGLRSARPSGDSAGGVARPPGRGVRLAPIGGLRDGRSRRLAHRSGTGKICCSIRRAGDRFRPLAAADRSRCQRARPADRAAAQIARSDRGSARRDSYPGRQARAAERGRAAPADHHVRRPGKTLRHWR
jgi:hypothetical protein